MPVKKRKPKYVWKKDKRGRRYIVVKGRRIYAPKNVSQKKLNKIAKSGLLTQVINRITIVNEKKKQRRRRRKQPSKQSPDQPQQNQPQYNQSSARRDSEDLPYTEYAKVENAVNQARRTEQLTKQALNIQQPAEQPAPAPKERKPRTQYKDMRDQYDAEHPRRSSRSKKADKFQDVIRYNTKQIITSFQKKYAVPKGYLKMPRGYTQKINAVLANKDITREEKLKLLKTLGKELPPNMPSIPEESEEDVKISESDEAPKESLDQFVEVKETKEEKRGQGKRSSKGLSELKQHVASTSSGRGLSEVQINKVMNKYKNKPYLGVISADEIKTRILPKVRPNKSLAFIMNTDKRSGKGIHWVAVNVSVKDASVEYYNSFGTAPTPTTMKGLKQIVDKLKLPVLYKFKVNRVQHQNNNSSNCGYFAMEFLLKRFRGIPFSKASGYDDRIKNKSKQFEKEIERIKKLKPFSYL